MAKEITSNLIALGIFKAVVLFLSVGAALVFVLALISWNWVVGLAALGAFIWALAAGIRKMDM